MRGSFGSRTLGLVAAAALLAGTAGPASAQRLTGTENGEWRYLGGDAGHTRSSALDQINGDNFSDLEVAWIWRGDNFGPNRDYFNRATPIYVDGVLYTVATPRRQVVAIDPETGETLWSFREPETIRHLRSPRQAYGKGVAYAEVNGRGVIFVTSPAFFLWALDAETGRPIENWGPQIPIEGFPRSGGLDLIPPLVEDWGRWQDRAASYDPGYGIPRELGMVTSSAPPIVVNGVVIVLVGHQPSYGQTRIENVPGDIMGVDAATGEVLWKFHVIPRPGEFGHDTWHNDAWQWSGDMSTWAPASADPDLGLVYLVTNASTVQSYAGHRPGDNLFGGCVLALDVRTGERRWHFQIHRSDQWNYDLPTPPMLMDLTVDGERIPALIQNTKQGLVFAFNRETGEPIWPIEDRPVLQTGSAGQLHVADTGLPHPPGAARPDSPGRSDRGIRHRLHPGAEAAGARDPGALPRRRPLRAGAPGEPHERLLQQPRLPGGRQRHPAPAGRRPEHRVDVRLAPPVMQRAPVHAADGRRGCGQSELRHAGSRGRHPQYDAHHRHDRGCLAAGRLPAAHPRAGAVRLGDGAPENRWTADLQADG